MEVHSRACLADGNLWCVGNSDAILVSKVSENPLCEDELFYCESRVNREELDFVLFVVESVFGEASDFRVAVLDFSACSCD